MNVPYVNIPVIVLAAILLTVLCWGSYGNVLHEGQRLLNNTKLPALICVGAAYFVIAIAVPLLLMYGIGIDSNVTWSTSGVLWSLAGGAAGALGALGIIMALSNGGTPGYVMPLVFGGAPVVNTLIVISVNNLWTKINPLFPFGLLLVVVGAVIVLVSAPRPAKSEKHAEEPAAASASVEPGNASPSASGVPADPVAEMADKS